MINTKNNNEINNPVNSSASNNWLQLTNVKNNFDLLTQYACIYQQHKQQKKWVLFINPEESSIEKLAHTHDIDASKILMVNYKSSIKGSINVDLAQIKSVLSKGNCSAVIVSNSSFATPEIAQLETSAKMGGTRCFLLKNNIKNQQAVNNKSVIH